MRNAKLKRRHFYVYLLANQSRMLYIGVTNDLERRLSEHKQELIPGYTSRYNLNRLVYYEEYNYVPDALAREKQLKGWTRRRKIALVEEENSKWHDLSVAWSETTASVSS